MDRTKTQPPGGAAGEHGATAALALAMLLASLGTSIANIALPALASAFAAPFAQVQGVVVAYLAALTVAVVVVGRLGDMLGLRPVLLAGVALFALASLLCALAPTLASLMAARALQGAAAAALMTIGLALARQTASEARLGRTMGLMGTVSALGTAMGPALGGLLVPAFGWRGVFWVQVPLAVLALAMALRFLPQRAAGGAARVAAGGPARGLGWALLPNLVVNVLVAAVMMATLVVGPFYLGRGLGLTEATVGLVMTVGPVISIMTGVPSGRLVDAWGAHRVLAAGLALLASGALLLALLPPGAGVAGYVLGIIVLTPGYQLFQAANNTASLAGIDAGRRGTASGLLNLSRNVGLMAGASLLGGLFAHSAGLGEPAGATAHGVAAGLRLTFLASAGLIAAAGVVAFSARQRIRPLADG